MIAPTHTDLTVIDSRPAGVSVGPAWDSLIELVSRGEVLVLTGAGMSTDSGIPAYRGRDGVRTVTPMTIDEFRGSPQARQRYWARAYAGWPLFASARPNRGHRLLAGLEHAGVVSAVITQNVDGLHQEAGSRTVVELHGTLTQVGCLDCGLALSREDVHDEITRLNATWSGLPRAGSIGGEAKASSPLSRAREVVVRRPAMIRPDGDVELEERAIANFITPRCPRCDGDALKPDVVFFGESADRAVVAQCFARVEAARGLLVLASSLQVQSGLRFVRRAARCGVPVVIVNQGATRGDEFAAARLDASVSDALAVVSQALLKDDAGRR